MITPYIHPQDILVLLKLAVHRPAKFDVQTLSHELDLSEIEISDSILRLENLGFFDLENKIILSYVKKFLIFDLPDLFPATPGELIRGTLTGAKPGTFLDPHLPYTSIWVWPNPYGKDQGYELLPLAPQCCFACMNDARLRDVMAVTETLRVSGNEARFWARDRLNLILGED